MMRKSSAFGTSEFVIWAATILLAVTLGIFAGYAAALAIGDPRAVGAPIGQVLALLGIGLALIVMALRGRLIRVFLICFTALMFASLFAISSHL